MTPRTPTESTGLMSRLYDVNDGCAYRSLTCGHCSQYLKIPYTYEALRNHIALIHPEMLQCFEKGWEALGTENQDRWRQGAEIDLETYIGIQE